MHLIGLAQERGARTLSELRALAAPRKRRVHGKRLLARGAPSGPASTSSATGTTRCSTSAAPATCAHGCGRTSAATASGHRSRRRCSRSARIEWRVLGSELEAALEELRLIRELEPPANSRRRRKEQGVYLRRRGDEFVVSKKPSPLGPIGSPAAGLARRSCARLVHGRGARRPAPGRSAAAAARTARPSVREPALRGGGAARATGSRRSRRSSSACTAWTGCGRLELCLIAPAVEPGWQKAFFVSGGALRAVRPLAPGGRAARDRSRPRALPIRRGADEDPLTAAQAEDLMLLHGFIRRPPPELAVLPLDAERIAEHLGRRRLPRAA